MGRFELAATYLCAIALVTACDGPETVTANETQDAQAEELANAQPVTLPPAIRESKSYRCKDSSVLYVSFMDDDRTALVRDKQEEPPIATLKAPNVGQPFVADGFSLSGSDDAVIFTSPDSGTQACNA